MGSATELDGWRTTIQSEALKIGKIQDRTYDRRLTSSWTAGGTVIVVTSFGRISSTPT